VFPNNYCSNTSIIHYLDLEWDDLPLLDPLFDLDLERDALFPDPDTLLECDPLLDLEREPLLDLD
jgi:hypothetical protein